MLTDAELMAVKVLQKDLTAARALADYLQENVSIGGVELSPVEIVDQRVGRYGCVVMFPAELSSGPVVVDEESVRNSLENWLKNPGTNLLLYGATGFQVYEFPIAPAEKKESE